MSNVVILVLASMAAAAAAGGGSLFVTAGACGGGPSMPVDAACRGTSTSQVMYDLCMSILQQSSPPNSELLTYAVAAAGAAALSCDTAADAGGHMAQDGSLPGDLRDACSGSVGDYRTARQAVSGVAGQLGRCEFAYLRQGYMDALAAVEDCTAKLGLAGGMATPLYGMVVANRDRTVLALRLATSLVP